jgi:glycosyltransferase involved in cell wall biosynthesis
MRILVVTEVFTPSLSGGALFMARLADQLAMAGDEVMVVTGSQTASVRTYTQHLPSGVTELRVPAIASPINPKNNRMTYNPWLAVRRVFTSFQPDCVHMHSPIGPVHYAALKQAHKRHIPVVITNHVMPENLAMNMPKKLAGYATELTRQSTVSFINKTDYLVSPTKTARELLGPAIKVPSQAITNGIDEKLYSPGTPDMALLKHYKLPKKCRVVLFTGRLDGEKRVDLLIDAFSQVAAKVDDAILVIVGAGMRGEDLKRQAKQSPAAKRIIFTGRISEEEKLAWLRFATLFVMPSPAELQCISALEALSCGLPVVLADQAALVELVQPGKNGYLFHYPDATDCAHAIERVLEDPIPPAVLRAHTRDWIVKHHTQAATLQKYQQVFKKLAT